MTPRKSTSSKEATPTRRRRPSARGGRIQVTVTQDIIENAIRRDSHACMIADAVRAAMGPNSRPSVDLASIRYTDYERGVRYIALTPPVAAAALVMFDQAMPLTPFTFNLRPIQVVRAGAAGRGITGRKSGSPTKSSPRGKNVPTGKAKAGIREGGGVPLIVGGTAPPLGPLSSKGGRMRAYGLRAMKP